MRVWVKAYGGLATALGVPSGTWAGVQTAPNGDNSYVMLIALLQVLKLNLNESPFYANSGVPAQQAVQQQAPPDYYVNQVQQQYSQYFTSLVITKTADNPPTYAVAVVLFPSAMLSLVPGSGTGPPSGTGVLATTGGSPITIGGLYIEV